MINWFLLFLQIAIPPWYMGSLVPFPPSIWRRSSVFSRLWQKSALVSIIFGICWSQIKIDNSQGFWWVLVDSDEFWWFHPLKLAMKNQPINLSHPSFRAWVTQKLNDFDGFWTKSRKNSHLFENWWKKRDFPFKTKSSRTPTYNCPPDRLFA